MISLFQTKVGKKGKNKGLGRKKSKKKKNKEKVRTKNFFENVSVPTGHKSTGHKSSEFAVPGSKKACHGHAGTV